MKLGFGMDTGQYGEKAAARFLRTKGFKISSRNYRTRLGEIDIIAENGAYIVFAEVKTRGTHSIAEAKEWVDFRKQQKIIKAALAYLSENVTSLQPRFDVIEVNLDEKMKIVSIQHIENAFTP